MTILKADILIDVNGNLQTDGQFSGNDIDVQIQKVLDDLSEEDLLVGTDDSQTLVSGNKTLAYPTGFRAMVSITLTITSSGSEQFPLIKLQGGHEEYRALRHNDDSVGIPRWYSDFNSLFHLWRPANQAFTSLIEFYKDHAQNVNTIEFADNFKNVIYAGATFYLATKLGRTRMINQWGALYLDAKQKRIAAMPRNPHIVKG